MIGRLSKRAEIVRKIGISSIFSTAMSLLWSVVSRFTKEKRNYLTKNKSRKLN